VSEFAQRAGVVLRQARLRRGLTLHAVCELSGGALRPSTIAGYEHGSRAISLERFSQLSALYGLDADGMLREILSTSAISEGSVVDLANLERMRQPVGAARLRALGEGEE
jgi:transcriptional regulator with XRE-family HTH domain